MQENNDMLYNVLLQADLNDMINLCYINNTSEKICHDRYFLKNKFDLLPFNIYKPLLYTFNNLLYVNDLVKLSIKLIDFMKQIDGIRVDFLNLRGKDEDYINIIKKFNPSLYNKLISISNDLTSVDLNFIYAPLTTQPILNDPNYGHIEFFSLMYKDGQFSSYIGVNFPHFIEVIIPINEDELIEYIVNVFLNYNLFDIGRWGYIDIYSFNKITLQSFLERNPTDINWEEA